MQAAGAGLQDTLILRPLEKRDVTERYLSWFRDEQVTLFLDAKNITRQEAIDYIDRPEHFIYAACVDGVHIGNLKVGPIKFRDMVSDLPLVIGDRSYWGKGLGTKFIIMGNNLAFTKHGIRKLSGGMPSNHHSSFKAYTRSGWYEEGRLKDHYFMGGRLWDRICVSMFNPACK
jgi:ribosomal-protein-alanine N-acetyltransferase